VPGGEGRCRPGPVATSLRYRGNGRPRRPRTRNATERLLNATGTQRHRIRVSGARIGSRFGGRNGLARIAGRLSGGIRRERVVRGLPNACEELAATERRKDLVSARFSRAPRRARIGRVSRRSLFGVAGRRRSGQDEATRQSVNPERRQSAKRGGGSYCQRSTGSTR
jgi:hypothetical protein